MTAVLALHDVSFSIGGAQLTSDVSFDVQPGERLALVGPNGAGKTTLMNLISGIFRPTAGRIVLGDHDVTAWSIQHRARAGLARTFQITNLLPSRTVAENLAIAVGARHRQRGNPLLSWRRLGTVWTRVDELIEQAGLGAVRDMCVGELAYGEQRKLEIVVAVARPARVVLLDEPGAGLTLDEAHALLDLVIAVGQDVAIIFIDHDLELIRRLATDVVLLDQGCVVARGAPTSVLESEQFRMAYLEGDIRA
ncbi:MAG: ABC transporter ATP-binding protein [Acidimicrobiia bacterium]